LNDVVAVELQADSASLDRFVPMFSGCVRKMFQMHDERRWCKSCSRKALCCHVLSPFETAPPQ
jgi:hypothetical protein